MVDIDELPIDILQNNVTRRNIVIETLRKCRSELKREKKNELDGIEHDDEHLGFDSYFRRKYESIIDDITELIKEMNSGDWSLSAESTKERENLFPCWECGKVGCDKHRL